MKKIVFFMAFCWSCASNAGIQEYQIIRLISMESDCKRESLERTDNVEGSVSFYASCSNLSHYPDGLLIHCIDPDNERSCKIQTQAKEYKHLKMLQE